MKNYFNESEYENITNNKMIDDIIEGNTTYRTVSHPYNCYAPLDVYLDTSKCEDNLKKKIKDFFTSFSVAEVNGIRNDMPILKYYASVMKGKLRNIHIIWRDHFLEENIGFISALIELGVKPQNIFAFHKGDHTLHFKEVWKTFEKWGIKVSQLDNLYLNTNDNDIQNNIKDFIQDATSIDNKVIIIDDGAFITNYLNPELLKLISGVIEVTEIGLRRIKEAEINFNFIPILDIAKSALKRLITYPEIANSAFFRINELLKYEKIKGRQILILGFGDAGEPLADLFSKFGASITIVDTDLLKLSVAANKGYNTFRTLKEALLGINPFLLIGASGYESINFDDVKYFPDNLYITAVATSDLNVFRKDLEQYKIADKPSIGSVYKFNNKVFNLLGDGRSINLYKSEAIANRSNDIFKAGTLIITAFLGLNWNKIQGGLQVDIVDEVLQNSNIYDYYYNYYHNNS